MKKIYPLLICLFTTNIFAQITITDTDIALMNSVVVTAYDTTFAGISVGSAGTNQTWDFSNLDNHYTDTLRIVDPATTPYVSYYPTANITLYQALGETYTYGIKDNSSLSVIGYLFFEPFLNDTVAIKFNPALTQITFPSTYNTQFNNDAIALFTTGGQLGFDSIRYTRFTSTSSIMDGWGMTITPSDTFNTLRQNVTERTRELLEGKIPFVGWITLPIPGADTTYTHITYKYIGNSRGGSIVEIATDSASGNIMSANYLFIEDTLVNTNPLAVDDYEATPFNMAILINVQLNDNDFEGGVLTTTVLTQPSNGSAVEQNGNVLYTPDNGFSGEDTFMYQICDNGSPSLCDTAMVFVTIIPPNQPPVAVDDVASVVAGDSVDILVLNNDSDPDGDLFLGTVLSGPNNGTATLQFDLSIRYKPNAGFTGTDVFYYELCDDGIPSLCDTGRVEVTVSPKTGIDDLETKGTILLYPNPFSNSVTIEISNSQFSIFNFQFSIDDVLGKEVFKQQILNPKSQILNPNLPNGIYFYKLIDSDGKMIFKGKLAVVK